MTYSLSDNEEKTVGIRTIYEITERTIDRYGQYFIVPDIELGAYWTNTSLPDETVIDLYHAHGESEQYHSEIKTDMDVERLPSGKFESNKLVLELTMIVYNILRIIGQESLKKKDAPGRKKIHRRRIRTVISNLMQFAGHLTEHAGRLVMSIGRSNRWRFTFKRLYDSFAFITRQQVAEYGNGSCTQMVQSFFERKIMQHFQNLVYNNKYGKHFLCAFSF